MSTLDPKGPIAQMQMDLFMVTVWVTLGIFIAVGGALAWVIWRYRERKSDDPDFRPPQGHGNPVIELSLIAVSIALLVVIAVPTLEGIWMMNTLPEPEDGTEVLEVNVRGYQWWWAFEYPELGITTANELVIPKGRIVKLNLRGEDVIHSFWLPKIAGKTDLIPGQANWMWIRADEEGHYYGQCAEYCGDSHAYMLFRADVISEEAFARWAADYKEPVPPPQQESWSDFLQVANQNPGSLADDPIADGARLFFGKGQCVLCHRIEGTPAMGVVGPDLTRVGQRKSLAAGMLDNTVDGEGGAIDPEKQLENLFHWIAQPNEVKPGNYMWKPRADWSGYNGIESITENVSDEEFRRIAHYLRTLN